MVRKQARVHARAARPAITRSNRMQKKRNRAIADAKPMVHKTASPAPAHPRQRSRHACTMTNRAMAEPENRKPDTAAPVVAARFIPH